MSHQSSDKIPTVVMAGGAVVAADQIMRAVHDNKDQRPEDATPHYVKAAIAGAIAIGAYEKMRRDEEKRRHAREHLGDDLNVDVSTADDNGEGGETHHHHRSRSNSNASRSRSHSPSQHPSGHKVDLLAEAVAAYALGRQVMGHEENPIMKLVAEGLGAAGLYREAKHDDVI